MDSSASKLDANKKIEAGTVETSIEYLQLPPFGTTAGQHRKLRQSIVTFVFQWFLRVVGEGLEGLVRFIEMLCN